MRLSALLLCVVASLFAASPARAATGGNFHPTCTIRTDATPGYVDLIVSGMNPKTGSQLNNGGGPKNYYLVALTGPSAQNISAVSLTSYFVFTFPSQGPGIYDGLVDYATDNGKFVNLTELATCSATL
jgi:hypothetical protein